MKYLKLFKSAMIAVAIIILMQPINNQIAKLMNLDSNLAYLGAFLAVAAFMSGGFAFGWYIAECVKEIKKLWQNKETGGKNA